jgi:TonB family protein
MYPSPRRAPAVSAAALTTAIALALSAPASAAARITLGPLVPVAPIAVIDGAAGSGACTVPDSTARITYTYPAQPPKTNAALPAHSNAKILLELDSTGGLIQARVVDSSGNSVLDEQALMAARGSRYAPEIRNCNSFKRSYALDVTFDISP